MADETTTSAEARKAPRSLTGLVVSNAMNKTIVVRTQRLIKHPLYKKYIRRDKKVYAHDEKNQAGVGDTVEVVEMTRPLSKTKRYRLRRIVERAK
ncbi:30S ribosomal protein S17 [Candidatus Poribacteria bacterium]|nr:30S ribosomal protein S17 [Candidatus Poribacteria bacterium]